MNTMNNFNVDYIVKEEEGVVVCIISDCKFNAVALVDDYTDIFSPCCDIPNVFLLNDRYTGVAKCVNGDTFDEECGKRIAYKKAYLKYITAFEKKVKFIEKDHKKFINLILEGFNKAVAKVNGKTEIAVQSLNKVLEEVNSNETT